MHTPKISFNVFNSNLIFEIKHPFYNYDRHFSFAKFTQIPIYFLFFKKKKCYNPNRVKFHRGFEYFIETLSMIYNFLIKCYQ